MARSVSLCLVIITLSASPSFAQLKADSIVTGPHQPVAFVQDPSDTTVQLVVQQDGRIRVLKNGVLQATDYLDLRSVVRNSGEQGLLGLAFAAELLDERRGVRELHQFGWQHRGRQVQAVRNRPAPRGSGQPF
jgi:hypothetical protein